MTVCKNFGSAVFKEALAAYDYNTTSDSFVDSALEDITRKFASKVDIVQLRDLELCGNF